MRLLDWELLEGTGVGKAKNIPEGLKPIAVSIIYAPIKVVPWIQNEFGHNLYSPCLPRYS
jgi:hypothetical protein